MKKSNVLAAAAAAVMAFGALTGCGNSESGFDSSNTIGAITREEGSGTRSAFIELFGIEQKNEAGEKVDHTTTGAVVANRRERQKRQLQDLPPVQHRYKGRS